MLEYRAFILDRHGRIEKAIPFECADDNEAIERAKQLADRHGVELWQRERKVAMFEHPEASVGS